MSSGTIEVMAWRLALVSRGFRRRRRSLGCSGQLGGLRLHRGVMSESGSVKADGTVGGMVIHEVLGGLVRSHSQRAVKLCISHCCEG